MDRYIGGHQLEYLQKFHCFLYSLALLHPLRTYQSLSKTVSISQDNVTRDHSTHSILISSKLNQSQLLENQHSQGDWDLSDDATAWFHCM